MTLKSKTNHYTKKKLETQLTKGNTACAFQTSNKIRGIMTEKPF